MAQIKSMKQMFFIKNRELSSPAFREMARELKEAKAVDWLENAETILAAELTPKSEDENDKSI